jgi:hypothetical protein
MVLDGDIRLFHWPGARQALAADGAPVRFESGLRAVSTLPHGRGVDRAEAFCELPESLSEQPAWLVLYDAPGAARREGDDVVFGDLLTAG